MHELSPPPPPQWHNPDGMVPRLVLVIASSFFPSLFSRFDTQSRMREGSKRIVSDESVEGFSSLTTQDQVH